MLPQNLGAHIWQIFSQSINIVADFESDWSNDAGDNRGFRHRHPIYRKGRQGSGTVRTARKNRRAPTPPRPRP
ncbi:hypothetical protein AGMMS49974_04330 [Deltaproteobacteria bacterium]|nr:hypothetical protein AGMMS49974_04330 [Deltaproteobacteria bacterium]